MEGSENDIKKLEDKMLKELHELNERYNHLNDEIETLKSNKNDINNSINSMNDSLLQVSRNVESIVSRIDTLAQTSANASISKNINGKNVDISMKVMVGMPLRKLAVGTISSIFTIVDKAVETTACIREELEDIVAEAHYNKQKRQLSSIEGKTNT